MVCHMASNLEHWSFSLKFPSLRVFLIKLSDQTFWPAFHFRRCLKRGVKRQHLDTRNRVRDVCLNEPSTWLLDLRFADLCLEKIEKIFPKWWLTIGMKVCKITKEQNPSYVIKFQNSWKNIPSSIGPETGSENASISMAQEPAVKLFHFLVVF